ncbi:dipeptidase [Prolixibacter denitrificans]|uniref:Dipeptidase n=1 Tax=Prolixibacter denitrificans TaxID=1541063 RepID=A0A2P8CE50_9BACT|nr:C69 family dipeptidase [Prolixibacter denitrificans]PSK83241.1 dipeptidase [Prolixibacter denitrificans]GET21876.1 dipeptidase [Prolixibacter denitrificans]
MLKKTLLLTSLIWLALQVHVADACTNFLITKGATVDGSTMITYAADSHTLYGEMYFWPAADHKPGDMVDVTEWDTGKFLGKIPQVAHTYQVTGNMNEHQLSIGETTFGGRKELHHQPGAIVDYGSLIYLTLQRAKTAREAIHVMTDLVAKYGYASEGESFSIADPNEVWILEMIGKGEAEKGAVWVARRIPDGYISGHANQARITTFPLNDPDNCLYSSDVISFAREKGWFDGKNKDFSFSGTYAPVDFGGARFCDARVWAGFRKVASNMDQYQDYAMGKITHGANGYATNRMPLWVKPDTLLTVKDVMGMMRDHFEGTALDMTKDPGAGPFKLPYRWRPLTWQVDSTTYVNERAISTQQTGFSFIAQMRSKYPDPIGGIMWFGVDDTYSTCYMPVYCGIQKVPEPIRVGNGDMLTWSNTSAFWVFNTVSNLAYLRYDYMIKDIQKVQSELETKFVDFTPAVDEAAMDLWNKGEHNMARKFLTEYSDKQVNLTVNRWTQLEHYLIIKYKDGNIMKEKDGKFERNESGKLPVMPAQPGYPEWWYRNVAKQTGDHLKEK